MTDHRFPEDAGTGAYSSGSGDKNDAANFAQAYDAIGKTDYAKGLSFDVDYTAPEVTIDMEKAVVTDDSATATQSGESRSGVAYVQEMDAVTRSLTDGATNYVYLDLDLSSDDGASYHIDTDQTPPSGPYLYLGLIDTDGDSYSLANELPSEEFASVSTGHVNVTNGPVTWSPDDGTLLEGLQEVPVGHNGEFADMFLGELQLVPSGNGTFGAVDFNNITSEDGQLPSGVTIIGIGMQSSTPIVGSGAHTLNLTTNDASAKDLSVRQEDDTGDYDAIRIAEREARVENVGIDAAPRYGINVAARGALIRDCEISGGDVAAICLGDSSESAGGRDSILTGMAVKECPAVGILDNDASGLGAQISGIIRNPGTDGAKLDYNNDFRLKIRGAGGRGLVLTGTRNDGKVHIRTPTNEAMVIDGSDNTVRGHFDGDIVLNGDNNRVSGRCMGTVTDNGTGNDTSDVN